MRVMEIEISGSPYERGLQYGKSCKGLIDVCISNYQQYIYHDTGMDWNVACRLATVYKKQIEDFNPKYIMEMQGIADGAGRRFEEILAINCRSELRAMSGYVPAECTTVAILPSASADGHTYTGQNWDNQTLQRECMVVLKIHQENEPTVMLFTEAGFIGGKGINSTGVSLLLNALFVGYEKDAVPLFDIAKKWLDRYFSGQKPDVAELPLAPQGNAFRQGVWEILCTIPYGEVITYGSIAKKMAVKLQKERMSSQAVGGAVGHNPISIIIPCHRVVGANGSLTGYAGGIEKKIKLLELEGVDMSGFFIPQKGTAL